jgi:hypothetical protein
MSKKIVIVLFSRIGIIAMSLVLALLMLQGVWDVFDSINIIDQQHAMEEIIAGLAAILVAFGVALEERETLLKFVGLYPDGLTPQQGRMDHHCHGHGLSLLLLGLFSEVAVYLIRMPDINTLDFDMVLIALGAVLNLAGGGMLIRLSWLLWRDSDQIEAH